MESYSSYTFTIEQDDIDIRIDKFLNTQLVDLTRSYLQKLLKDDQVLVNNKPVKPNYRLRMNDSIMLDVPLPQVLNIEAQDIPLDIIYEDQDILIVNKPKGMVVHPSAGHTDGTLVNAVLFHCKDNLSGINGVLRPGIVHRIDRDTTGLLVVCKNDLAHVHVSEQLKEHTITRKYNAIVYHNFSDDEGTINSPIGRHSVDRKKMAVNKKTGKEAITHYKVLNRTGNHKYTHVECQLETGRTHQIRVHMASINHPLLGDHVYGPERQPFPLSGQCLHARVLGLVHPRTGEYMEFESPLPEYFQTLLDTL